jgi:hypothetical protein
LKIFEIPYHLSTRSISKVAMEVISLDPKSEHCLKALKLISSHTRDAAMSMDDKP